MATWARTFNGVYSLSGVDWVDDDLPFATIDAAGGNYSSYTYFSAICYDTLQRRFIFDGPGPFRILPNEIVSYKAPSSIYGYNEVDTPAYSYKLRIESLDGLRWAECYTNEDEWPYMSYYKDSEGQDVNGYDPTMDNFIGRYALGTLTANVNGTVTYRCIYDTQYSSSCSSGNRTALSGTTPLPVFNVDEELKLIYINNAATTWYIYQWGFNVTLTDDSAVLTWMPCSILELTCEMGATQDNSASDFGLLIHNQIGPASAEDQAKWFEFFDHAVGVSHLWGTTYHRLASVAGSSYQAKLKFPLTSEYLDWLTMGMSYGKILLFSEDGNRWISLERLYDDPNYIQVNSSVGILWTGTEDTVNGGSWMHFFIKIREGNIYCIFEVSSTPFYEQPPVIPFTDIFIAGEKIIPAVSNNTTQSSWYSYLHTLIASPDLPSEGENQMRFDFEPWTDCSMSDLITERYICYVKTKIKNTKDISDPDSLMGMDPGAPSDLYNPLKAGDSCIVFEKYNRVYYYTVQAGFHATELPDFVRITDSLYWELVDVTLESAEIVPEQYNIVGLVDTNPVTVTHSKHNRVKSYMPPIQLIHGEVIRTEGILGYILSDTQIRFETIETDILTNLKVNVYVSS